MNASLFGEQSSSAESDGICYTNSSWMGAHDICDPFCDLPDREHCIILRRLKQGVFSVTLIFDIVTLFTLLFLGLVKSAGERIIICLLVCNMGDAICALMNDGIHGTSCVVAGFGIHYFTFTQFIWEFYLTLYLFVILVIQPRSTIKMERVMRWLCWIIPMIPSIVPFITGHFGPSGAYCWIHDKIRVGDVLIHDDYGENLRFYTWWIPVFVGLFFIAVTLVYLLCRAKMGSFTGATDRNQRMHKRLVNKNLKPLAGYGIAFLVLHGNMIADRIVFAYIDKTLLSLKIIQLVAYGLYGSVLCTLFYMANRRAVFHKRSWKKRYRRLAAVKTIKDVVKLYSSTVKAVGSVAPAHSSIMQSQLQISTVMDRVDNVSVEPYQSRQGNDNDALSDIVIALEPNYQQGAAAESRGGQITCPTQATDSSYDSANNSQTSSQKDGH